MRLALREGRLSGLPFFVLRGMGRKAAPKKKENPVIARLAEANENALLADGYEDALIGVGHRAGGAVAVYDWEKCLKVLMDRDKMTYEEAQEFFDLRFQHTRLLCRGIHASLPRNCRDLVLYGK
jgi:hypothetical protein